MDDVRWDAARGHAGRWVTDPLRTRAPRWMGTWAAGELLLGILGSFASLGLWAGVVPLLVWRSSSSALPFPCGLMFAYCWGEKQEAAGLLDMMQSVRKPLVFRFLPAVPFSEVLRRAVPSISPLRCRAGWGQRALPSFLPTCGRSGLLCPPAQRDAGV